MVDEAKLHNPVPSTFEVLVVWCAVRHCRREESGPFCSPMPTTVIAIFVHPTDLLSTLLRCNGFSGIQKAVVDQSGSRPPKSNHNFFGISLGLGSALELLLDPTTELVYCWLSYTIRFSLHVTIWSRNGLLMLCSCCIK